MNKRSKSNQMCELVRVICVMDRYPDVSLGDEWEDKVWKDAAKYANAIEKANEKEHQSVNGDWDESCSGRTVLLPGKAQVVVESKTKMI